MRQVVRKAKPSSSIWIVGATRGPIEERDQAGFAFSRNCLRSSVLVGVRLAKKAL
jgi:hypothetical protein